MIVFYSYLDHQTEEALNIFFSRDVSETMITKIKEILEKLTQKKLYEKSKVKESKFIIYTEIGPLPNYKSPWCTNALSILKRCGITCIERIERSEIIINGDDCKDDLTMTNYKLNPPNKWKVSSPKPYSSIDLYRFDNNLYGFDKEDIDFYKKLFSKYNRPPTDVELADLAQSNSEHSRHWFFNGKLIIDNKPCPLTLMDLIKNPHKSNKRNSLIAFSDNSSAICGFNVGTIIPIKKDTGYEYTEKRINYDITFTAETHNFPTGIAPFPGAATGTGGRIRDNIAVGMGAQIIAGTAGYCVGNFDFMYKDSKNCIQNPLTIEIEASNGASDYGNKIGEPIISGFTRSFGITLQNGERFEYRKPIMFTGGIGLINRQHLVKEKAEIGMLVVRLGGPAYRIGVGGGMASSKGYDNNIKLDAVQRGDPEMANRLIRVIRACIELEKDNPISSIHDQGAGGMANVTKEIIASGDDTGAFINIDKVNSGDSTLSILEKWIAEYQEQVTTLVRSKNLPTLQEISKRENCPLEVVGIINNTGKIEVFSPSYSKKYNSLPVDLNLNDVLNNIPQKTFHLESNVRYTRKLEIPHDIDLSDMLIQILQLVSVGSKRFLTNKVDRSVTGLIAQQQCVGPLHTPLANVAIVAHSHYETVGTASAIGEQPIKGLISSEAMARMSVGEMLTNLMWAKITSFEDIRCSGNWMWPGKDKKEGYHLYKAVTAFSEIIGELGIVIDGGKDSLSMFVESEEGKVKSPGTLVVSGYAPCPDINKKVTPDLKEIGSDLVYFNLGSTKYRLGGSALAQILNQIGDISPDFENISSFKDFFNIIQSLIEENLIISGHDISDGGLLIALLEMCFAGDIGCNINMTNVTVSPIEILFAEELGVIIEVANWENMKEKFSKLNISAHYLGKTNNSNKINFKINSKVILNGFICEYRKIYEMTSYNLELNHKNFVDDELVNKEYCKYGMIIKNRPEEFYSPRTIIKINDGIEHIGFSRKKFTVGIIRDEGSNGDREMAAAFKMGGFEVRDICMSDFETGKNILSDLRGIAFVGGFTFSDVFGAGSGWYATITQNKNIKKQFQDFRDRKDTFSLGVCNGCQLMAKLGWVDCKFVENDSKRFESRFPIVKIHNSKAIMFSGMEECRIGIWVSHKEGKCISNNSTTSMSYVGSNNNITEDYPENPSGSENGVAGVCSDDGRHLAIMPHPERCFLDWQFPYKSKINFDKIQTFGKCKASPWFLMFFNAYCWCNAEVY